VHRLTKEQARRIGVRAQLLDADRPTDLLSQDVAFTPSITAGVRAELADLATWLRIAAVELPK